MIIGRLFEKLELLTGKRDPLTPPRRLINNIGGGDFRQTGEEFLRYFVELGKLLPTDRVLDVGCGCGRIAVPLTKYLVQPGGYCGFDIVDEAIDWCRAEVSSRFPYFHFLRADVYNQVYHPQGRFPAAAYEFRYRNSSFDLVCLTSVFTHMLWPDMNHYLSEIARVLKPGGRCLVTFFSLNLESEQLIQAGKSALAFPHPADRCWLAKADKPEWAVAFPEHVILECFSQHGLKINSSIRYGRWAGRPDGLSFQDIFLATKVGP